MSPREKRNRRSVSVTHETYVRLKAYCDMHGRKMAQVVEQQVNQYLDMQQPKVE